MKTNNRLKHEREQRGWSQSKLAELVGTNPATVGRWERGISLPYPVYREKLCELFGKDVQELGLIEEDTTALQARGATTAELPSSALLATTPFIFDPAIPILPVETGTLVGRDELLTRLKRQLYSAETPGFNALSGLPGVGKTTLTLMLAYDHEVQTHFSDGVLWAGPGTQSDIEETQARWGTQLGLSQAEVTDIKSRDDWARTLRALIGLRHMLLIIDDVWKIEDALAFQVGGPHCMYLFTTRFPQIAVQIASSRTTAVPELSEDNGIELLTHFVPRLVEQDDSTARRLVNSVGALPLALVLMGRYLQAQAYNEQPRRLRTALQELSNTEKRLRLIDQHGLSRPYSSYSPRAHYSLQSVIALSDERLDPSVQSMLRALAVFPPKPNTFSERAAIAISEQPAETLDALCDAGLLESSGPERYMVHQTISDYARAQISEHEAMLFERMVTYTIHYIELHKNDYKELEQEHTNILAALEEAAHRGMDSEFVRGIDAFALFLRIRGLYYDASHYLQRAYHMARNLGDNFEEMEILAHLGQIAELQSEYKQAENYLRTGLHLARQYEQARYICLFLAHLGAVQEKLGEYTQAESALREGLSLARQLDLPERICQILIVLGRGTLSQENYMQTEPLLSEALQLARQLEHKEYIIRTLTLFGIIVLNQENYDVARSYFMEALTLAYQMGYRERITRIIANLSAVLEYTGEYDEAEHYLQEGLQLARQIGNRESVVMLLNNLGSIAWRQGHYVQAQAYLQDALLLARQINHPRLISHVLYEQGEVALSSEQYNEALAVFHEALTAATAFPETRANAHYGLARVMALQKNIDEALLQGETSAQLFETLGLPKAATVRHWLTTLSISRSEKHSH